jgi:hypothetical protein
LAFNCAPDEDFNSQSGILPRGAATLALGLLGIQLRAS